MLILFIILAAIILLLLTSVVISVVYDSDSDDVYSDIKVTWLFVKIHPKVKKFKKIKLPPVPDMPPETAEQSDTPQAFEKSVTEPAEVPKVKRRRKKPKKAGFGIKDKILSVKDDGIDLEFIRMLLSISAGPFKNLIKRVRVTDVYVDCTVGAGDAAASAILYGVYCTAVYSVLTWLDCIMRLSVKEVNMEVDFQRKNSDNFCCFKVKLSLGTMLGCILWLTCRVVKLVFTQKQKKSVNKVQRKVKKVA